MKTLGAILISILIIGCGDDAVEPPEPIVKPEPEPIQHETPDSIPQKMADHFALLQEHMTQEEWNYFLGRVQKTCSGKVPGISSNVNYESSLSENARKIIRLWSGAGKILPNTLNTEENRIIMAGLAMPDVKRVELDSQYRRVLYLKNDYTIVIDVMYRVDNTGIGGGGSHGYHSTLDEHDYHWDKEVHCFAKQAFDAFGDQWSAKFYPRFDAGEFADVEDTRVRLQPTEEDIARLNDFFDNIYIEPHFFGRDNIDLVVLYFEAGTNSLLNPEHAHLTASYDDAPQATPEQIAEYNRIHSPDAYDCSE